MILTCISLIGEEIHPEKREGEIPKYSERLLALYPDLTFNRLVAEKILAERFFTTTAEIFAGKPDSAVLHDLLECFRVDGDAEEFLWYYIEEVTGEKNLHLKAY